MRASAATVLRAACLVALAFTAATAVDYYGGSPKFCQSGQGCEVVHAWSSSLRLDSLLPALGLIFYTFTLGASLSSWRWLRLVGRAAAILGAFGAAGFLLLQGFVIGAWCFLCVGVDTSALVAGAAAAFAFLRPPSLEALPSRNGWWAAWVLAVGLPVAWGTTSPPPAIPAAVAERYERGATNVLVMSDPECPYCRSLYPLLEGVIHEARSSGRRMNVIRVAVPLPFHKDARAATKAVFCAEASGKSDAMRDRVYAGDITRDALFVHAQALGLERSAFEACLNGEATEARVEADLAYARKAGMQGLPTVYIEQRAILGFDTEKGALPYRMAILTAGERGPARRPLGPFLYPLFAALFLWAAGSLSRSAGRPEGVLRKFFAGRGAG
jgi:uncharacterized membrane protein